MPTTRTCPHGSSIYNHAQVNADGITACCGAHSSIFTDDGSEYCKCCFGSVGF